MKREGQFSRVYLRRWVANFTSSLSKVPRTVTCLPSILCYQGASVGRVTSPCFFFSPSLLVATTIEVVPWRQYFARMIGQKAASSGLGDWKRVHAARRGSEGGQMLTPQPHAPIQWGWMYGKNNGSKAIDRLNRVPPFFFFPRRCAPSRYLSPFRFPLFPYSLPPFLPLCLLFFWLSFCLRQEIRNRYIIVHDLHPAIFPANIYAAFDRHKAMVKHIKREMHGDPSYIIWCCYINVYIKSL